jgi:hypothetical protein
MPTTYPLRSVRCWAVYDPNTGQRATEPEGTHLLSARHVLHAHVRNLNRALPHSLGLTLLVEEVDRITRIPRASVRHPLNLDTFGPLLQQLTGTPADLVTLPFGLPLRAEPQDCLRPYQGWTEVTLSVELETL